MHTFVRDRSNRAFFWRLRDADLCILVNDLAGAHVLAEKVDSFVCGPEAQEVSESKQMVSTGCAVTCGKAAGSPDSDVVSDTSGQVIRFVFLVPTYL